MYSVYMHTVPNGKRYIGMTAKRPEERWAGRYTNNKQFRADICLYGWENIKHEVLFSGLSRAEAEEKERELIAAYDSTNPCNGYNIAKGGPSNSGYHHSEETKNKIRSSLLGVPHTDERNKNSAAAQKRIWSNPDYRKKMSAAHVGKNRGGDHPFSKRVNQFDLQGNFIQSFSCITDAERLLGIDHRMISDCCNKKQKTCKGYKWEFAESEVC